MIRKVHTHVLAFDVEWVPDPQAGRILYKLPDSTTDRDVIERMWQEGGATEEDPQPYLKTVLCRIVSITGVLRSVGRNGVELKLITIPALGDDLYGTDETAIIGPFLTSVGKKKPQIVGFNSQSADLKIIIQRSIVNGIQASDFCERPQRYWEGTDYFHPQSDDHIDLKTQLSSWGKVTMSLHELASLSGIPGKMDVDGAKVSELWLSGEYEQIVRYNQFDALTTYLVWLRAAHFGGHFAGELYDEEQKRLRESVEQWRSEPRHEHLQRYLEEWERLEELVSANRHQQSDFKNRTS